jgi:hypothetical protein
MVLKIVRIVINRINERRKNKKTPPFFLMTDADHTQAERKCNSFGKETRFSAGGLRGRT